METIWYGKCPVCGVVYAKGETRTHKRTAEHFWGQVDRSGKCWVWVGNRYPKGYGHASGRYYAHRRSWELTNGPIQDGLWVLHRCDNPPCVRPDHLFLGTAKDNARDREAKGRGGAWRLGQRPPPEFCKRGHPFTPENTEQYGRAGRTCKTCHHAAQARYRRRRRAA